MNAGLGGLTFGFRDGEYLVSGLIRMLAFFVLLLLPAPAVSQEPLRGVALVIGQSEYEHLSPLPNPANDADAIETLLSDLGFDSIRRSDRKASSLMKDLERFAEDAEGADVAVLYYSGHGIEAGGENFLIPVDADLSSLDDAGEKLVPVSALIERLKATVPVVIVMLDACRDNPFPSGSTLRLSPGAEPVSLGNTGLGLSRSVVSLKATNETAPAPDENVGTVIAFAAEPGKVALDGDAGSNSPYAAALLRHFDAMAGEEFGMVMRMVAEEVYLKTGGRQRPWVNESLRRQLYFGEKPEELSGDEGAILRERRGLLVTIAALPEFERRSVERIASDGGVPMDALYAMLDALGQEAPDDPAELENMLRSQTQHLRTLIAEQNAVTDSDAEIARLSALSREAVREGALSSARNIRLQITNRIAELDVILSRQEDSIQARRIELAAAHAESAEISAVAFDHLAAAGYWRLAFEQVSGRDERLAIDYRTREINALTEHGSLRGDNRALEEAVSVGEQTLGLAERLDDAGSVARTRNAIGNALSTLGTREGSPTRLEQAAEVYRMVLQNYTRDAQPLEWSLAQNNLGIVLGALGGYDADSARLSQAVDTFRAALEVLPVETARDQWAMTKKNLAAALTAIGDREGNVERLKEAVDAYRSVLQVYSRQTTPLDWVRAHNNLGNTLVSLAKFEAGTDKLSEAVNSFNAALAEATREKAPSFWGITQNNLGNALLLWGERDADATRLAGAADAYHAALQERRRESVPLDWAATQNNIGNALSRLGTLSRDPRFVQQAIAAYRAALEERTRERVPLDWAATQSGLAAALVTLSEASGDLALMEEAVRAYRAALEERTRERVPLDWARTQNNLGNGLSALGMRTQGTASLVAAVEAFEAALQELTRERVPLDWATIQTNMGIALVTIAERDGDRTAIQRGINALNASLEERKRELVPLDWAASQNNLGYALTELGRGAGSTKVLDHAADAYRAALQEWTRDRVPLDWAMVQFNLGNTLSLLAHHEDGTGKLDQAVAAFREALREWTAETTPQQWASARNSLGGALIEAGRRSGDPGLVSQGRDVFVSLRDFYRAMGQQGYDSYFEGQLSEAEKIMRSLQ